MNHTPRRLHFWYEDYTHGNRDSIVLSRIVERSQLDSKRQVIILQDRVTTIHKRSSTPTKMSKINSRQI